jgi:hypothetical protein
MADRRIDGFFYGLFMDAGVLRERHVEPVDPRRAYVDHYALRIGRRATLVPTRGERSYGVVMALTHAELDRLYAAPGLEDYRPEAVVARCLDGGPVPALCYTLLRVPEPGESNRTYATRLREVLKALDFPPEYVASVS